MKKQLILETERLILRPFNLSDSKRVQELAGDTRIGETTLNVPHPYEDGMAESWIGTHKDSFNNGDGIIYAIVKKDTKELVGTVSLMGIENIHKKSELAYWIGVPYWRNGYCSEACHAIIEFGFKNINLNKIYALAFEDNISSWKVMEKVGMKYEGTRRQDVIKNGIAMDSRSYSILREEIGN